MMKKKNNWKKTYKAIVINGVNILLLGHHVAKAPAGRVLEGYARSLGTQNPVNIVTIIELVVKSLRDFDGLRRVTILNDDQMIGLKKRPPLLQEVQVSDRGDHDVQLVFQQRHSRPCCRCCRRHFVSEKRKKEGKRKMRDFDLCKKKNRRRGAIDRRRVLDLKKKRDGVGNL